MLTDWLLIRRLAAELDRALRGKRIRSAGRMVDGRFALAIPQATVALDVFGPTPIVTLEGEATLEREAGYVRAAADALGGLRFDAVRARRGDRLIAFECSSRSRFGVQSGYRLVAELVPRFGNIVLLKDDTVVCAAKEFAPGVNRARATVVGRPYEPPPLPVIPGDEASFGTALAGLLRDDTPEARDRASRGLRAAVPLVPRLVADSLVAEAASLRGAAPAAVTERTLARARALVDATDGPAQGLGDLFAYRDGGRLVQCHVVPLAQYAALAASREPALIPLLAEVVGTATSERSRHAFEARRASLRARVERRRAAFVSERSVLEGERDDAAGRDALRIAGELLYAHLGDVPPGAVRFVPASAPEVTIELDPELDAKANAAAIFNRYRKATTKLEHTARRLTELERSERFADELAWELERAEPETLDDVADSIERLERRKAVARRERARRQKPLDVRVSDDARIYVGRSPRGNADLTFRIARPGDLWFHVRATPGAHVVLQFDSERRATADELQRAAGLAAYHSKARNSDKVSVDYTERKYVRRQQNAPPGLVWYTNARTLLVAPAGERS
jgi:predicted ribosome quality control (RQC) complex YloA/Tae2 family protein